MIIFGVNLFIVQVHFEFSSEEKAYSNDIIIFTYFHFCTCSLYEDTEYSLLCQILCVKYIAAKDFSPS